MVLSPRERTIVIFTLAVVGVGVLYWAVLSPVLDRLAAVGAEKDKLTRQLEDANDTVDQASRLTRGWKKDVKDGDKIDLKSDWASAGSQLLTTVDSWARSEDAGVKLTLWTPVRGTDKGRLERVGWEVTGSGTWRSIINLLWKVETARIPIRVSELQVSARRDGVDDLTAMLKVSTLCSSKSGMPEGAAPAAATSQVDRPRYRPRARQTGVPEVRAIPATEPTGGTGGAESPGQPGPASQPASQPAGAASQGDV